MNRRIANKILKSPYYFDLWTSPHETFDLFVPHSGKHWYLFNKACDTVGGEALKIKEEIRQEMLDVVDYITNKEVNDDTNIIIKDIKN